MKRGPALVSPCVLIGVGLLGLVSGIRYGVWHGGEPGAGLLPAISGALLFALTAIVALTEMAASTTTTSTDPPQAKRLICYMVAVIGFALLMRPLGTMPTIILFFLWILRGVERLPWRLTLAVTAGASVGTWLLFDRLLQVPLPSFIG